MNHPQENDTIGSYRILHKIAEGGMAEIYKALQPSLQRTVVVKRLKDPNREIIARFKKEARMSAGFGHENLLAIYDFIYHERSYYLVMEHVDGEDLHTIIDYLAPVPPSIAALLIMEIARGLEYTHARNIIHRDIKPGNVLISFGGDVKLIDFGVAKDDTSTRLTVTGLIVGTPAYMSPEQATGESLSPQSDLYALGILLYELLTGIKPFAGDSHTEILAKISSSRFTPAEKINPDIPHRMRKILKKALRTERQQRYRNATELIYDLEKCVSWQLRSRKKEVISRFLKKLDKNTDISSDDSIRAAQYVKGFSRGWKILKYATITLILYLSLLLGRQFHRTELGYIRLDLPETGLRVSVDGNVLHAASSRSTLIGPLLTGEHRIEVTHPEESGLFLAYAPVSPQDTLRIDVLMAKRIDSKLISIFSIPEQANVLINGKTAGKTPLLNTILLPGKHRFELNHAGYNKQIKEIQIGSHNPCILHFFLSSL